MLKFEPFYQEYERTLDAFSLAFSTIYFEQMTIAPKKGIPYSNEMLSRLSKQAFIIQKDQGIRKDIARRKFGKERSRLSP